MTYGNTIRFLLNYVAFGGSEEFTQEVYRAFRNHVNHHSKENYKRLKKLKNQVMLVPEEFKCRKEDRNRFTGAVLLYILSDLYTSKYDTHWKEILEALNVLINGGAIKQTTLEILELSYHWHTHTSGWLNAIKKVRSMSEVQFNSLGFCSINLLSP